jgi:hypothetical protein
MLQILVACRVPRPPEKQEEENGDCMSFLETGGDDTAVNKLGNERCRLLGHNTANNQLSLAIRVSAVIEVRSELSFG